jgi:hypothetical protein
MSSYPSQLTAWSPGLFGNGLYDGCQAVIWATDRLGNPTHDQGAAVSGLDLLEAVALAVDPDGESTFCARTPT